jgi:hypothetical protein
MESMASCVFSAIRGRSRLLPSSDFERRKFHGEQCRQSQEEQMKIAEGLPKADE